MFAFCTSIIFHRSIQYPSFFEYSRRWISVPLKKFLKINDVETQDKLNLFLMFQGNEDIQVIKIYIRLLRSSKLKLIKLDYFNAYFYVLLKKLE